MDIFVTSLHGRRVQLEVEPSDTLEKLLNRLRRLNIAVDRHLELRFKGKRLRNGKRLSQYNIRGGETLHSNRRLLSDPFGDRHLNVQTENILVLPEVATLQVESRLDFIMKELERNPLTFSDEVSARIAESSQTEEGRWFMANWDCMESNADGCKPSAWVVWYHGDLVKMVTDQYQFEFMRSKE